MTAARPLPAHSLRVRVVGEIGKAKPSQHTLPCGGG